MDKVDCEFFAGSKQIMVNDVVNGISFPVLVHYPTRQPSVPTTFGLYMVDVSVDADLIDKPCPLVLISHGNGGSYILYRTISTYLAKNGYIVALIEHYGNNRNNNQLENTIANLINRPRHVSITINALLAESWLNKNIMPSKIAVIGHSMGGYTALALAGGVPFTREGQRVEVTPDNRIKAIVLLAPGAGWFANSLNKITVPVLMLTAEHDEITPEWNAKVVLDCVADKLQVTHKVIKNAGHFSFLSPFPAHLKKAGFRPATDPEGFDREQFHAELPVEILHFLSEKL